MIKLRKISNVSKAMQDLISDIGLYDNWMAQVFEILCFKNIDRIKSVLGISGV